MSKGAGAIERNVLAYLADLSPKRPTTADIARHFEPEAMRSVTVVISSRQFLGTTLEKTKTVYANPARFATYARAVRRLVAKGAVRRVGYGLLELSN